MKTLFLVLAALLYTVPAQAVTYNYTGSDDTYLHMLAWGAPGVVAAEVVNLGAGGSVEAHYDTDTNLFIVHAVLTDPQDPYWVNSYPGAVMPGQNYWGQAVDVTVIYNNNIATDIYGVDPETGAFRFSHFRPSTIRIEFENGYVFFNTSAEVWTANGFGFEAYRTAGGVDYTFGTTLTFTGTTVPEPSTMLLFGCALAGLCLRKRDLVPEK